MVKQFDIVIPHYNGPTLNILAQACLRSIVTHSANYRVIWVQNGGRIPQQILCELDKCEEKLIILNASNLGFIRATNLGILKSNAPYVILLNNDTEAAPNWLEKLKAPLDSGAGLSGPLSSANGSWQGRWIRQGSSTEYILTDDLNLAFFCVMIRRDVIERIGLLDEEFGLGLGDDDDYCARSRVAGFKAALVQDLTIVHRHRSTFRTLFSRAQIGQMQRTALSRLRKKGEWNR